MSVVTIGKIHNYKLGMELCLKKTKNLAFLNCNNLRYTSSKPSPIKQWNFEKKQQNEKKMINQKSEREKLIERLKFNRSKEKLSPVQKANREKKNYPNSFWGRFDSWFEYIGWGRDEELKRKLTTDEYNRHVFRNMAMYCSILIGITYAIPTLFYPPEKKRKKSKVKKEDTEPAVT